MLLRKSFATAAIALTLISCGQHQSDNNTTNTTKPDEAEIKKANAFFDRKFDEMVSRKPIYASILGLKEHYGDWDDISDSFAVAENNITKTNLDSLKKSIDFNKLDEDTKLSYKLFEKNCNDALEAFPYRFHDYPVNQEDGLHTSIPTFLINVHRVDNLQDAKDYISRLNKINHLFDQLVVGLKTREQKGVIAPKFVYPKVLAACANIIKGAPFDKGGKQSDLLADISRKTDSLKNVSATTKDSIKSEASKALLNSVKPAYEKLMACLKELDSKATTTVGAWSLPDGDAYYQMNLRHQTTTNMTPQQIFDFGQSEVTRIQGEIKAIMKQVGFKSDNIHDFFKYVTDPNNKMSFLPNTDAGKQAYLDTATRYINTMKQHLDELFITKPKADIVVKAVEKFREPSAGTAFYEQPAIDGSRPGRFYVNLYDMTQSPMYQLEALAYHEGIPGHHMQISIAQELQGVPKFRKYNDSYTAYIEGWGLYSERIPKEIGFYKNPYSDFGRLSMELMRSARCVVDPGIHYKHWTREQAIQYFKDNTAEPPIECEHAIERYIIWPGQATAYKIGMNKILELREMAKKKLGSKFNIREFHDQILCKGAVPLDVLEENINAWIAKQLSVTSKQ
jgi:uncharacterized protein (DUF885 family)